MKVRKLAVALALAGGLGSGVAQALGLGEIELQSYLNEPLNADIELRKSAGVSPGDVFVNIAPDSAYDRVGIDRNYFLTKLNFQVTTAPDGNLVVNVSSREPLREPYLNFLVEVTWPNGRLMREYAVLVDPPVYAEESGVQEQVSAPAASQSGQSQQITRQAAPAQPTTQRAQSGSSGQRSLGPTTSSDTLWTIAARIRPNNNVSMQQTMLAIQDLNQDAFIDGNINRLKRGEILRIPDENQIRSRSRAEANQEVAAQNRALSTPKRTVDASGADADVADGSAAGSTGGDQLSLIAADDSASRDAEDGGSAGGDGEMAGGADAGTAVAMEELESSRRENEELTGRVDDLQDQVQTLQRLLELKNSQLAEMQNAQSGDSMSEAGEQAPTSEEPGGAEMAESGETAAEEGLDTEEGMGEPEMADDMSETSGEAGGSSATESETDMSEPAMEASDADAESAEPMAEDSAMSEGESMSESEPVAEDQSMADDEPMASDPAQAADATDTGPTEKPFPGNIIDAISNNFLYQVALGGGLVVFLLLLLLLARRNANREKAFYDQLNGEPEGEEADSFDLSFEDEEGDEAPAGDAIAEADAYIAYGRNDQAAQTLETAISREPSRSDLRLKLLGVYADNQDRDSFDKQFREVEALDDEDATAEARSIQSRLEEAESMPSIDDLESQLRSDGGDQGNDETYESDYMSSDYESESDDFESETSDTEASKGGSSDDDELDFEDMDLDLPDDDTSEQDDSDQDEDKASGDDRDDLIEYDLSDLESSEDDADDSEDDDDSFDYSLEEGDLEQDTETDSDSDDDDLSLDFESSESEETDEQESEPSTAPKSDSESDEPGAEKVSADDATDESDALDDSLDDGALDESFLDELDAELDKVADEDEASDGEKESELDDLELDVSDEDLALMEEFSESDDADSEKPSESDDDDVSLEDELGLEDALSDDEPAGSDQAGESPDKQKAPDATDAGSDDDSADDDRAVPVASGDNAGDDSEQDLDESDLGDDDDFDFLAGTDEAATKLDLARAYVEMGDVDGARDILEEVALEGNDEQKAEAQDLLKNLS